MTRTKKRITLILASFATLVVLVVVIVNWGPLISTYKLWREFESIATNEQGYKEYHHRQSGIVMVLLPGGTFTMGAPGSER